LLGNFGRTLDERLHCIATYGGDSNALAWRVLMDHCQQRLPWSEPGQKWVPMTRIFSLSDALAAKKSP
jgi:hypothetical protein